MSNLQQALDQMTKPQPSAVGPNEQTQTMLDQLGAHLGLRSPFVYVGATNIVFKQCEGYPSTSSRIDEQGYIQAEQYVMFHVNGGNMQPGNPKWKMIVCYEPNDTYTVYLYQPYKIPSRGASGMTQVGEALDSRRDVYCDELRSVVEQMYDRAIQERQQGFIKI